MRRPLCLALLAFAPNLFAPNLFAQAAPVVKAAPATTAAVVTSDWVNLTLVTDDHHVALYVKEPRKVGVGDEVADSWSFVCQEPCGVRVDPRRSYRVMGESLVPSVEFNLAPGSGSVALRVRAKQPPSSAAAVVLGTTGAVAALGGVLFLLLDLAEHGAASAVQPVSAQATVDGTADTYGDVGAGMLVGGVVLGSAALIYVLSAGKTTLAPADSTPARKRAGTSDGVHLIPFGFSF